MNLAHRVDLANAAVLVIDVQNDFCDAQGLHGSLGKDVSRIQLAIERLERFLPVARAAGVPVIFVRNGHTPDSDTAEWLGRHATPRRTQSCRAGSWGAEFYHLRPTGDDIVIDKHRYSAFTGTSLEETLQGLGRRSLLLCGVTSNTCVETTLRDAVCRDYLATMVEDCCDAYTAEDHERAIVSISGGFGIAATSTEIAEEWSRTAASAT